jgi:hypothetical protein
MLVVMALTLAHSPVVAVAALVRLAKTAQIQAVVEAVTAVLVFPHLLTELQHLGQVAVAAG